MTPPGLSGHWMPVIWVAAGAVAFLLFWVAARRLGDAAGRWLVGHQVTPDAVVLGRRIVYVALLLAGATVAVTLAFSNGNVAILGLVLATVVTSFGVQDVLKNYVSGYYVLLERHIHVGDTVEFETRRGVVEDIRLRVTLVRGDDGALVVVPNAQLFNGVVVVRPPVTGRGTGSRRGLRKSPQEHPAQGIEAG